MRKAILLFNPHSGRSQARRVRDVEAALAVLREAGIEVSAAPTASANAAAEQARQAVSDGCDTVFACGGDGTIHDVLQGLVGSQAALALIPLGTANALAHDLGIPLSPAAAARASLTAEPRRIAVGKIEYQDLTGGAASRFFTVAAGVGVDAYLFYKLRAGEKSRLGMAAYYATATRLWLTHAMPGFTVEVHGEDGSDARLTDIPQLLAVRIRYFGGVLRQLAPGASLDRNDLRVVLFRTHRRLAFLRYVVRGLLGSSWRSREVDLLNAKTVTCHSASQERIFVEADGELLGTLPAKISIIPDALTLLVPRQRT